MNEEQQEVAKEEAFDMAEVAEGLDTGKRVSSEPNLPRTSQSNQISEEIPYEVAKEVVKNK
jgi:hypothetical protein